MKPAPALRRISFTLRVKPSGLPSLVASSDNENCVFAIQIGNLSIPKSSIFLISFIAFLSIEISAAPYISLAIVVILFTIVSFSSYKTWKLLSLFSSTSSTFSARALPPSPPFAQTSAIAKSAPISSHFVLIYSTSSGVSVMKLLSVTTTGTPNLCKFSMCFSRLQKPFLTASRFGVLRSVFGTPPLYFNALTVATRTTASGFKPAFLHLISKNFSAPKSAPKPASVIVMSESFIAVFVAFTLLQPWAILAKGPP